MPDPVEEAMSVVATETVLRRLRQLRFGMPLAHGSLGLVPLYAPPAPSPLAYIPLQAAVAGGLVTIAEQPDAAVPSLRLVNHSARAVLIIDGDEVAGGLQNRLANTTLLAPPKCAFDLPVSCVEQGRWEEEDPRFAAGEAAYPSLRAAKVEDVGRAYSQTGAPQADQGRVWEEVAASQSRLGIRSETGAMRDSYRQREALLQRTLDRLPCPDDGPIGVVATVAGRARCADLFDRPETLAAYWPRLVRSYALEALDRPRVRPSLDSVLRLMNRPHKARRSGFRSPGLGLDVRFDGNGVTGAALVLDDAVVHAALFRRPEKVASGPLGF